MHTAAKSLTHLLKLQCRGEPCGDLGSQVSWSLPFESHLSQISSTVIYMLPTTPESVPQTTCWGKHFKWRFLLGWLAQANVIVPIPQILPHFNPREGKEWNEERETLLQEETIRRKSINDFRFSSCVTGRWWDCLLILFLLEQTHCNMSICVYHMLYPSSSLPPSWAPNIHPTPASSTKDVLKLFSVASWSSEQCLFQSWKALDSVSWVTLLSTLPSILPSIFPGIHPSTCPSTHPSLQASSPCEVIHSQFNKHFQSLPNVHP